MTQFEPFDDVKTTSKISRRTLAVGAAWSVPVIAMASAAPAMAGSPGFIEFTGQGCKTPGNGTDVYKGYVFGLEVKNTLNVSVIIDVTDLKLDGNDLGDFVLVRADNCASLDDPFTIPPNTTWKVALFTKNQPNSQNGQVVATYNYTPNGGVPVTGAQAQTKVNSLNPWTGGCRPFSDYNCGLPTGW